MNKLREALTEALNTCPGLSRQHGEKCADAVLRVLAEGSWDGDTQQVRKQINRAVCSDWPNFQKVELAMAVVAPILAERDAAIEWAERVEADRKKRVAALKADLADFKERYEIAHESFLASESERDRIRADLTAARTEVDEVNQQLDRVRAYAEGIVHEMTRRKLLAILDAKGRT
jgi:septal ring factor EnvC (AmiA/AmiB activator)